MRVIKTTTMIIEINETKYSPQDLEEALKDSRFKNEYNLEYTGKGILYTPKYSILENDEGLEFLLLRDSSTILREVFGNYDNKHRDYYKDMIMLVANLRYLKSIQPTDLVERQKDVVLQQILLSATGLCEDNHTSVKTLVSKLTSGLVKR